MRAIGVKNSNGTEAPACVSVRRARKKAGKVRRNTEETVPYHSMTAQQVFNALKTRESGLAEQEAEARLAACGENALPGKAKGSAFRLFLAQFKDVMTILLICAAVVSAVVAYVTEDAHELADTGILLFIILLNTFVGFLQQYRADHAIETLKKNSVCRVKAVRGGRDVLLDSTALVPGDIIFLEEGDRIPADCRILSCEELRCDESSLTGESASAHKDADVSRARAAADRKNMLYCSTFVVHGQARAVVVRTGADTEIGRIADMLGETGAEKTPLEKTLAVLGRVITASVIAVAAIIFVFGVFFKDVGVLGNFMSAVAVAVAAIPEGMPAVVTVIMAMGVQKMSRERAIVRKLHAVETLGGCSCICSDKTGTLTENRMTVEVLVCDFSSGEEIAADAFDAARYPYPAACMHVCHSVRERGGRLSGDPTEVALVRFTQSLDLPFRRIGVVPFDSERKRMQVTVHTPRGDLRFEKGAADVLVRLCASIDEGRGARPMTDADRARVLEATARLSARALRVLGFAYGEGAAAGEEGLVFCGVCGMIDPPRAGAAEAVAACKTAGIKPVMITGDHRDTAFAVAQRLGIASDEEQVLTGEQLDAMTEQEQKERIPRARVFARVSPKHKRTVVERFREAGDVVAMTGDGINDAPGIRRADIGIAMGKAGTDVTKSAADMVIADDNFATIVTAVREGRRIFANIRRTIQFFLATNLAEVLSILVVSLAFYRYGFLTSTQLLWINLITDSLPVLSLGAEGAERDVMRRPPSRASDLFSPVSLCSVFFYGAFQAAVCVAVFVGCQSAYGNAVAVTATFFVLSFLELFHSFNIRSERHSAFGRDFFRNKMLFVTVGIGVAVNLVLCAFAPLRAAFSLSPLTAAQWAVVFGASLSVIPAAELYKCLLRLLAKKRRVGARRGREGQAAPSAA